MRRLAIGLALATSLGGCAASRPVVYPNDFYLESGQSDDQRKAALDQAIAECEALAKQTGVTPGAGEATQVAKTAGIGAVGGAAAGAVGGAIWGNPGMGAATGAASGVVWTLFSSMVNSNQPNAAFMNFVTQCLAQRGYQPVGWQQ
ncbi:MAG: glycine zipper family protein [Alphaproteobacteria bacterium]